MRFLILRWLMAFLAIVAIALPAQAAQVWTNCSGGSPANGVTVTRYDRLCLDFAAGDTGDSRIFIVGAKTALLCFDPDINTEGADATKINFRFCPNGIMPAASPENECFKLSNDPITGITGAAGTQDSCERVGPGTYYVEITTTPAANDEARVTIQGEAD